MLMRLRKGLMPEGRERERPKEAKPKRARASGTGEISDAAAPTGRGTKPLKRGR
jgi:hypothetical protein